MTAGLVIAACIAVAVLGAWDSTRCRHGRKSGGSGATARQGIKTKIPGV